MFKSCFDTLNYNQCCLVKNLTSGNVRWVVRQYAYIVSIVTEIEIIVCEL